MKNDNKTTTQTLEDALMAFRHSMTSALVNEAKQHGWSLSHFEVIKFIAEQENPTMKDIAVQLHITPPSASTLIDTLIAKELVTRSHASDDRRTIHISLTPKTYKLLSAIYKKKTSIFNAMLSRLSEEDKIQFARILQKCIIK